MSSNRMRYVGGDCKKIACKPNPLFPFQKGDLLYMNPTDKMVRPAASITPGAGVAIASYQEEFAEYFVGVADEKYGLQTGEFTFNMNQMKSLSVSVCTAGRFEFDCPAQAWVGGQKVGICAVAGLTGIADSQTVDACATDDTSAAGLSQAIGIVYQQEAPIEQAQATQTRVVVDIQPAQPMGTIRTAGTYAVTSGQ